VGWNLLCVQNRSDITKTGYYLMTIDQQKSDKGDHADRSAWAIWGILVLIAVATLPFAVRNSEVVRHIAAMCGFNIG
jgi:hypothetical protein